MFSGEPGLPITPASSYCRAKPPCIAPTNHDRYDGGWRHVAATVASLLRAWTILPGKPGWCRYHEEFLTELGFPLFLLRAVECPVEGQKVEAWPRELPRKPGLFSRLPWWKKAGLEGVQSHGGVR